MAKTVRWDVENLHERVEYEASTLRFYLAQAFSPGGGAFGPYEVEVPSPGADLLTARASQSGFFFARMSDSDVMAALRRFAPLAFQAAFKVQDMVIEWVLRTNGSDVWRFSDKVDEYWSRRLASSLVLPPFLAAHRDLEGAHFALYRRLSQRRNALIHDSSFELLENGTLRVFGRGEQSSDLTLDSLRAYIEMGLLVVDLLIGRSPDPGRDLDDLEAALSELRPLHNMATPVRRVRWVSLALKYVGEAVTRDAAGLALSLDLRAVRRLAASRAPVNAGDQHRIRLTVEANDGAMSYRWTLEPADVRGGDSIVLRDADPRCAKTAV